MATIVGGIGVSHVPALGLAMAKNMQADPYWEPFFKGLAPARAWIDSVRPDAVVIFYNDHGLNFFLDKMPTFAVGAAPAYLNADEGWGLPVSAPFPGDPALSWRIINHLIANEFDLTTCQEMLVDHAFALPLKMLWPDGVTIPIVPVAINTVQHPLPSIHRCFNLGRTIGEAIAADPSDRRVLVIGSGGLSHQLDGERAGFINKAFDTAFLEELVTQPERLSRYSVLDVVEQAGTQGVELLMWVAMRAALGGPVRQVYQNYHIPISNTAACLLALEPSR
jgi:protocatechuate 4,5-dioxygenase beta chain